MKKITFLFVALIATLFCACSDDENKDEYYDKQVTAQELESGTATYRKGDGSKTYYLVFQNGKIISYEWRGKNVDQIFFDYKIEGDSLYISRNRSSVEEDYEYHSLYIRMVHWGYDKTSDSDYATGGDQLLIRGDKDIYMFHTGFYDLSDISLK